MAERLFERKIYQRMLDWKRDSNGKTALLIKCRKFQIVFVAKCRKVQIVFVVKLPKQRVTLSSRT